MVFLHDWLQVFPRDQILILKTEDYSQNMPQQLNKVFNFLGARKYRITPSYITPSYMYFSLYALLEVIHLVLKNTMVIRHGLR